MPELPEVETLKLELAKVLIGKKIKRASRFNDRLAGVKITSVDRRAKLLLFHLSNKTVMAIHLKMTGQLVYSQGSTLKSLKVEPLITGGPARHARPLAVVAGGHPEDPTKYTRAVFKFTDGSTLRFNDLRKFGWIKVFPKTDLPKLVAGYGPEPLADDFNLEKFKLILKRYPNRPIKQALLDQTLIAGVGNIYADESCFAAGLRPARPAGQLKPTEINRLYRALRQILKLAIKHGGTSARNYRRSTGEKGNFSRYLKVYGRAKLSCRRCGGKIEKIKLASRGTHFCPKCQK